MDVLTPRGQVTLDDENRAARIFERNHPSYRYISTNKARPSKADALVIRDNQLEALVLTSCRYDCTISTFETSWDWEWLLTWRKLALGAWLSKHLQSPLVGFLYIVGEKTLLVKLLYDPLKLLPSQRWQIKFRCERTATQATCNGGIAVRDNAFIKMDAATRLL